MKTWKDDAVVVATRCGPCGKPRRGFPSSARAERHVHADSRDAVDSSGREHPLSEQVINEHGAVALRAQAAQTDGTSEQVAVTATSLAEEALTAPAALVDRVRDQRFAALESIAHTAQIGCGSLMTESITALLASARAVPRACRRPWSAARQAATRTITPTLTPGHVAGRRQWPTSVRRAAARPVRSRAVRRAGYYLGQQPLLMSSTHCVLRSTSAVLSLESAVRAVGERSCRGYHFAF